MTHAGALAPAIAAMMDEDPASRWDMATSAKRLGGIATGGATAVMPVVGAGDTAILPEVGAGDTAVLPVVASGDTAVLPVVASGDTAVMPVVTSEPLVEPTKRFEVAAPPVEPTKQHEVAAPPPEGRGSGRRRMSLAFAAFLVAAIGMAFLMSQLGDKGSNTAAPATTRATAPAK